MDIIQTILQTCNFLFSKPSPPPPLSHQYHQHSRQYHQYVTSINNSKDHNPCPLLESAIELLKSKGLGGGGGITATTTEIATPVRLIQARMSGRRMLIVRSSGSSSSSSNSAKFTSNHTNHNEYLITIGRNNNPYYCPQRHRRRDSQIQQEGQKELNNNEDSSLLFKYNYNHLLIGKTGYHCTCRSFYERLKKYNQSTSSNTRYHHYHQRQQHASYDTNYDKFVICKHLLVARIAPFLHYSSQHQYTTVDKKNKTHHNYHDEGDFIHCYSEDMYNELYVNLSMGLWY